MIRTLVVVVTVLTDAMHITLPLQHFGFKISSHGFELSFIIKMAILISYLQKIEDDENFKFLICV